MLTVQQETLDDAMNTVFDALRANGELIQPRKGPALEIIGASVEIADPRSRVSRSQTRGRIFSALGELLWYLAGTDDVEMISHYIPAYASSAYEGRVEGGYGPRLFGVGARLVDVVQILRDNRDSRRAVVQIFDHADLQNVIDVPCTTSIQFLARAGELNLVVSMRSNDAYLGFPHDVFAFTMLQEIVACQLGLTLGRYVHFVGSMHLYEENMTQISRYLDVEGWQSPGAMPAMPGDRIDEFLFKLLAAEASIRKNGSRAPVDAELASHAYWGDLVLLLRAVSTDSAAEVEQMEGQVVNSFYSPYLRDRRQQLEEAR
jgi:thymidylate synthase